MQGQDFEKALSQAAKKSSWAKWLTTAESAAQEILSFLKVCYSNLSKSEQSKWAQRVSKGDERQVEATIHELVALEILRRLHLAPKYEPLVGGKTPDIHFNHSGQEFLADVYVAHSAKKTYRIMNDSSWESVNKGDRAWEIEDELMHL